MREFDSSIRSHTAGNTPRSGVGHRDPARSVAAKPYKTEHTTTCSDAVRDATERLGHTSTFANAVGYVRVSTAEQGDSELGIEAQRASVTAAAERLGLTLAEVHVEVEHGDRSITKRPVLMRAVASLRRGDVLLIAKRDRLARDRYEVAIIEREIKQHKARIVSAAGEGTENDDPASVLFRGLLDLFAEYERLIIAARTKAALAVKRDRRERAGQLAFGFQLAADGTHVEPNPVEQDKLARLRALKATGRSTRQIASDLNRTGDLTRKGTPWRYEYVARLLRRA